MGTDVGGRKDAGKNTGDCVVARGNPRDAAGGRAHQPEFCRARRTAGLSPEVLYAAEGVSVLPYIESQTLQESDEGRPQYLARIVALMKSCHRDIPQYIRGPVLAFRVFHVVRDYAATLAEKGSDYTPLLEGFPEINEALKRAVGQVDLVFGHNGWMAANILDDGARLC